MAEDDIVAYTFRAETLCPPCTIQAVGRWLGFAPRSDCETTLDIIAETLGIDREDEVTFDNGYFPKVVFRDSLPGFDDDCDNCGEEL